MKLMFKQQANGDWRWRTTGRNGRREGASTEGYSTLAKCKANYVKITTKAPGVSTAEIVKSKKRT